MLRRVLVVEDEQKLAELVKVFLVERGFAVLLAHDGEKGLELARRERPDLVLSDVLLPRLTGWELCRRIKSDPVLQEIRVVLMTAVYTKSRYRTEAIEVGADDFVSKPLDLEDLAVRLTRLLSAVRPAPRGRAEDSRAPSPPPKQDVPNSQPQAREPAPSPRPGGSEAPAPRPGAGDPARPSVPPGSQGAPGARQQDPRSPLPEPGREGVAPQSPPRAPVQPPRPRAPEPPVLRPAPADPGRPVAPGSARAAADGGRVDLRDPVAVKREGVAPYPQAREATLPKPPDDHELPAPFPVTGGSGRPSTPVSVQAAPSARLEDLRTPPAAVNREGAVSQGPVRAAPPPQEPELPAPFPDTGDAVRPSAPPGSRVASRPSLEDLRAPTPSVRREGVPPGAPVKAAAPSQRPREPELPAPFPDTSAAGRAPVSVSPRVVVRASLEDLRASTPVAKREGAPPQPVVKPAPPAGQPGAAVPVPDGSAAGGPSAAGTARPASSQVAAGTPDLLSDVRPPDVPRAKRAPAVDVDAALAGLVPRRSPPKSAATDPAGAGHSAAFNERLAAMRRSFAAALPATLARIERAWAVAAGSSETSAWEDLARLAHDLAGSAGSFGFPAVGDAARELEEVVRGLLESGRPLGGKARQAVKQYVERLGALVHLL